MSRVTVTEVQKNLHGTPVGVPRGFANEDEYFEYRLLHDPRFHKIVERSRHEYKKGKVVRIEDLT